MSPLLLAASEGGETTQLLVMGTLATATVGAAGAVLAALVSTRAHREVKSVRQENRTDHTSVVEAVDRLTAAVDAVRKEQRRMEARADAQDSHLQDLGRNIGALRDQFVAYLLQRLDQEKGKQDESTTIDTLGSGPRFDPKPPDVARHSFGGPHSPGG